MKLTTPITDYIPGSVLTTHGDIVERGAAQPERLAAAAANLYFKAQGVGASPIYEALRLADTGVHIGNDTRDAAGAQVITGVGYQSSLIIFLACDQVDADDNWSVGFDNGTVHACLAHTKGAEILERASTKSIEIMEDAGNFLQGLVSTIGADGFTITWNETGARTCDFIYLCLP